MATVVENEYNKELRFTIKGLAFVAKGRWPGTLDTLSTVLSQFYDRNQEFEFGLNSWPFVIGAIRPFQPKPDHNEYMWPVATAWIEEQQKSDCPDRPYGKIFATKIAKGWRVELWHDVMSNDPTATEVYMGGLFQALVEDGLQPVDTSIAGQSESAGRHGETAVSSPGSQESKNQVDLVALTDELNEHFNESELRDLCFRLKPKVDYENIKGDAKRDTARELVTYMERRGRIEELIVLCRQLRPNVLWDANPKKSKD